MPEADQVRLSELLAAGFPGETQAVGILLACARRLIDQPQVGCSLDPQRIHVVGEELRFEDVEVCSRSEAERLEALEALAGQLRGDPAGRSPAFLAICRMRYQCIAELHDDCRAALAGLPLVHGIGGQGRLDDLAVGDDPRGQLLVLQAKAIEGRGKQAQALKPVMIIAALLLLAVWFSWLVPRLQSKVSTWRPVWAEQAGRDRYGRWAELTVSDYVLRFRLLQRGEQAVAGDLWVLERELPRGVWQRIGRRLPGRDADLEAPVCGITYGQAKQFCGRFNALVQGVDVRLPTRAEWAWMAALAEERMGPDDKQPGIISANPELLEKRTELGDDGALAWWKALPFQQRVRMGPQAHKAGDREPDALGLVDLAGNVAEWCADADPQAKHGEMVVAGGSWFDKPEHCRLEVRRLVKPNERDLRVGMRLVMSYDPADGQEP